MCDVLCLYCAPKTPVPRQPTPFPFRSFPSLPATAIPPTTVMIEEPVSRRTLLRSCQCPSPYAVPLPPTCPTEQHPPPLKCPHGFCYVQCSLNYRSDIYYRNPYHPPLTNHIEQTPKDQKASKAPFVSRNATRPGENRSPRFEFLAINLHDQSPAPV